MRVIFQECYTVAFYISLKMMQYSVCVECVL